SRSQIPLLVRHKTELPHLCEKFLSQVGVRREQGGNIIHRLRKSRLLFFVRISEIVAYMENNKELDHIDARTFHAPLATLGEHFSP
ncbi:MAG: hypothetical protein DMG36_27335, partial [Acidobacteria bacterium]